MNQILDWFKRQLSNPQIVFLALVIVGILLMLNYTGSMLAPVIASVVIAYLMEGIITRLTDIRVPRMLAVWLVFLGFIIFLVSITFGLLPVLYNQMTEVVQQIPVMLARGQAALMTLPERYPELISIEQVEESISGLRHQLTGVGQSLITSSLTGAANLITIMIYVFLVPILIFFFLKDKDKILQWFTDLLPRENQLAMVIWNDVDIQIGNYIRGKFWEVLIVWAVSFVTFSYLGLQFSMLLSVLVGVSVLVPYVGAAVVTLPVTAIAWFQWGWTPDFIYVVVAYLVIQFLDGNLLVPVMFSGVVNIHPVAIMVAVLFFGGLWGFWGVFFAIPLASLVQAIILAWPKPIHEDAA